jgi:hypothetical protein
MLPAKASMFHLQCIFLSETCWSENVEAAENGHIFPLLAFFNALPHTPELHAKRTKLLQSRPEPVVCMCAVSAYLLALF